MDGDFGRFLQLHPPARLQRAALAANALEQLLVRHVRSIGQTVARRQGLGVVLAQVVQQLQGHLFVIKSVAADGAAGGQVVAGFGHDDARPQNAGRVIQVKVVSNRDALLGLGHTRLVAGLGGALAL